jgi:hypothetical protein
MGATFLPDLNATTHYLVVNKPVGAKYEYAKRKGSIHMVTRKWLDDCIGWKYLRLIDQDPGQFPDEPMQEQSTRADLSV